MKFSHINNKGKAAMVDVSAKQTTERTAEARAEVVLGKTVFKKVQQNEIAKGDVLTVAKIAGIQAAKKTAELIPLCHNIFISQIEIECTLNKQNSSVNISAKAKTTSVTGIEMEALAAAAVAALTIYDMCKALDKKITINNIHLVSKTGGKSGNYFV